LATSLSINVYGLACSFGLDYHSRTEAGTFNMNLYARTLPVANDRTADTARSLGKTSRNMIILVSLKLAVQIELVAVAIAAQLKIDFMLGATTRSVCGLATDALGRFVGRLDGTGA
jgi:hypothetical protein